MVDDAVLEAVAKAWRFESSHPHQRSLFGLPYETNRIEVDSMALLVELDS